MTHSGPRRSQQERVAESNERLLSAAIELIGEQGFDRTTTAEIGRRAGYSHGMVHARFGTKDALLESILRGYEAAMLPDATEGASGLEQVLDQLKAAEARSATEPQFFRAFCVLCFETVGPAGSLRDWVSDWFRRYVTLTASRLRNGQKDGSVRNDVDPAVEAQWLLDAGIGMAFRWLVGAGSVHLDKEFASLREQLVVRLAPTQLLGEPATGDLGAAGRM